MSNSSELPQLFVRQLQARFGVPLLAVVLYGSWVRGKRDTMLDFYVILQQYRDLANGWQALANRMLPPNVYNTSVQFEGRTETAKFATLTLSHLEAQIDRGFHSYFWSRWAQPMEQVYVRDDTIAGQLSALHHRASQRVIREILPALPRTFSTVDLWSAAFGMTYACELRSEPPGRALELAEAYAPWLESLTREAAPTNGLVEMDANSWHIEQPTPARLFSLKWRLRRWQGKLLSVARLLKAALTFERPLDYVLWKVERHSGVREHASPLQRRYPLLFAWPVLWRLYRRGGFR